MIRDLGAQIVFYELNSLDNSASWAEYDPAYHAKLEVVTCPKDPTHRWAPEIRDLHLILPARRYVRDFVCAASPDVLLQERTVRILQERGLTGFETRPVSV